MRAERRSLLLVAAFLAWVFPLSVAAQKPTAERPMYAIGEKWIRSDGVYELIRIEGDRYVFAASAQRVVELTKDLALARVQKEERFAEFDPPAKILWPLQVGKSGVSYGTWRWTTDRTVGRFSWQVEAYEDVTVPAGTFKAFRIRFDFRPQSWWYRTVTLWYAPEVRQFVKGGEGNYDFLAFSVAAIDRPTPLTIALSEPTDGLRMGHDNVVVIGKVSAGKGVARVSVTLNGVQLSRQEEKRGTKNDIEINVPLKLVEGKNVLLVTATDAGGETRQEARVLFFEKPARVAASTPKPEPIQAPTTPRSPSEPTAPSAVQPPAVSLAPPPKSSAPQVPRTEPEVPDRPTAPIPRVEIPVAAPPKPEPRPPAIASIPLPPPFQLVLSSPADQARFDYDSIALAGVVAGGKGVSRVVVTLNGQEVQRVEDRNPRRVVALNLPVKLREGQNTLAVTATEPDGTPHQDVRTVHYEKLVPLTIDFRYPGEQAQVAEPSSVIVASIASSKGVARVSVSVNGADIVRPEDIGLRDVAVAQRTQAGSGSVTAWRKAVSLTIPVVLREGMNVIVISGYEPDGTVGQAVRTVTFNRPIIAALPPPVPLSLPNRWAVIVGVGTYDNPAVAKLRYSVRDAEALYDVLTGRAGFKKEHVLLLTDKTERKPTLRNIKWALGTFLARSARKDDTVMIFFAGHGAPEIDPRGIERDGLAKYLVPADADPDDLYSTALPMDELQAIFGRIEAERVVAFLDACYSGAVGGRTFTAKSTRAGNLDDQFLERLTRAKGRAIITASRPSEVSMELDELKHGVFTYYLVEGLKGAGDLNRDGIVTLQELYEYVEQKVTQKARAAGGNQHPIMKGELEGSLPIVRVIRR